MQRFNCESLRTLTLMTSRQSRTPLERKQVHASHYWTLILNDIRGHSTLFLSKTVLRATVVFKQMLFVNRKHNRQKNTEQFTAPLKINVVCIIYDRLSLHTNWKAHV